MHWLDALFVFTHIGESPGGFVMKPLRSCPLCFIATATGPRQGG
jgi:hypothetical protein